MSWGRGDVAVLKHRFPQQRAWSEAAYWFLDISVTVKNLSFTVIANRRNLSFTTPQCLIVSF